MISIWVALVFGFLACSACFALGMACVKKAPELDDDERPVCR